jgi:hypothetical protein
MHICVLRGFSYIYDTFIHEKPLVIVILSLLFINQNLGYFMMHNVANCVNGKLPLTSIACVALLTVFIAACKKDNKNGITQKLMNRWSLVSIYDTTYVPNVAPFPNKYDGAGDDYMDFRKDGNLYSSVMKALDTAAYMYSETSLKLTVRNFKYQIVYLTDNSMVLWDPHFSSGSATTYISHKVILKR